jgi:hypothetical protein
MYLRVVVGDKNSGDLHLSIQSWIRKVLSSDELLRNDGYSIGWYFIPDLNCEWLNTLKVLKVS